MTRPAERILFRQGTWHLARLQTRRNGRRFDQAVIRHPGAAAIVACDAEGRLLMIHQWRPAPDAELWEVPAGTRRPGEEPLACARRELAEEAGFTAASWHLAGSILPAPGISDEVIVVFCAGRLAPCPSCPDNDEWIEQVAFFSPRDIDDMMRAGRLVDAKTLAALALCGWFSGTR